MTRQAWNCLILVLILAMSSIIQAQQDTIKERFIDTQNELTVLSWNIQMLPNSLAMFSRALRKKQAIRCPWIIAYLLEISPDVICFQEVFDKQIKCKLKKGLKALYPYQIDPKMEGGKLTSSGLLIISKQAIKEVGYVTYTEAMNEDKWAAKGCIMIQWNAQPIYIANTHLQAGGGQKGADIRVTQYKQIRQLIDRSVPPNNSCILVGDMNTRKTNAKYYPTMIQVLGLTDAGIDDPRPYTIDSTNSWNNHARGIQLDYVLHRLDTTVLKQKTIRIIRPKQLYKESVIDLADHYGVLARYQLKE